MTNSDEIFKAAKQGTIDAVLEKLLLNNTFNVNQTDDVGKSILHYIASRNDFDQSIRLPTLITLLKNRSINFDLPNRKGSVPLHHAISHNCHNMVKLLLPHTSMDTKFGMFEYTFLHYAISFTNHNIAKCILEYDLSRIAPTRYKGSSLMLFIQDNRGLTPVALARSLAKKYPELIATITSVLESSLPKAHHLSRFILDNQYDELAFHLAIGADPNEKNSESHSLLHIAVGNRNTAFMDLVLKYSPDLEAVNKLGTPLDRATAIAYSTSAVEKLIQAGAKITYKNKSGNNILHTCGYNSHGGELILQFLFDNNKLNRDQLNEMNNNYQTPLHLAESFENIRVMEKLLEFGAPINAQDNFGRTPLFYAHLNHRQRGIDLLESKGASLEIADRKGTTPRKLKERSESESRDRSDNKRRRNGTCDRSTEKKRKLEDDRGKSHNYSSNNNHQHFFSHREKAIEISPTSQTNNKPTNGMDIEMEVRKKDEKIRELNDLISKYQIEIERLSSESGLPINESIALHFASESHLELSEVDLYSLQ